MYHGDVAQHTRQRSQQEPNKSSLIRLMGSKKGDVLVLSLCWTLHLLANTLFLLQDRGAPQGVDSTNHTDMVYQLVEGTQRAGAAAVWQELRISAVQHWPPLVHLMVGSLAGWVDSSLPALRLYNLLFLAVLLVGVYWVGTLCHGRKAGVLAALCVSFIPGVHGASRDFGLDFPCMAMVALTMGSMLATRGFSRLPASALFGVLAGLTVLTRGQSGLFLFLPFSLTAGRALIRRTERSAVNVLLALVLAAAVSSIWWFGRFSMMLEVLAEHAQRGGLDGDQSIWGGVKLYLGGLVPLFSLPSLLVCLALVPGWLRRAAPGRLELAAWLVFPLLVHILLAVRGLRYLLPLVPALPLMASVGVMTLRRPGLRRLGAVSLVAAGLIPWLLCGYPRDKAGQEQEGCSASHLLCGHGRLNHRARKDPALDAARRLARALMARHPHGEGILLMVDFEDDPAINALMVDQVGYLRSMLPRIVYWTEESAHPPWLKAAGQGMVWRYLLSVKAGSPAPEAGERLHQERLKGGLLETVTLWRMKQGSSWLPLPPPYKR